MPAPAAEAPRSDDRRRRQFLLAVGAETDRRRHRPFIGDLRSWTRDEALDPDWLRVGTDITNQGPFNAAFSLQGALVPEPSTWAMMHIGFAGLGYAASAELENRSSRCK
jgi:hypothetical protein